jgi:predicted DNA-binding transcriptional regulator AlpA
MRAKTVSNSSHPRGASLLLLGEVRTRLGGKVSRTTLWRWARTGNFPRPVQLGTHRIAWRSDEVEAWISSRAVAHTYANGKAK